MDLSPARFAGYFPKHTPPAPAWLGVPSVGEIASVSTCIAAAPDGWILHWTHNSLGFYDCEALARQVVEGAAAGDYDLYAYQIFPLRCRDGALEPFALDAVAGEALDDYQFLGYDIVTRSTGDFFECSPLSCNAGAREYLVNRYCLIDELAQAWQTLRAICAGGGYEPGPYYLFEVYRKRRPL
jgi:hypothetical protein